MIDEMEAKMIVREGLNFLLEEGMKDDLQCSAVQMKGFLVIEEAAMEGDTAGLFDEMLDVVRANSSPDSNERLLGALNALAEAAQSTARKIGGNMGSAMLSEENIASRSAIEQYAKDENRRDAISRVRRLLNVAKYWSDGIDQMYREEACKIERRLMYSTVAGSLLYYEAALFVVKFAYSILQASLVRAAYERLRIRIILAAEDVGAFPYVKNGKRLKTMSLCTKYIGHYRDLTGYMRTLDHETEDSPVAILIEHYETIKKDSARLLMELSDLYAYADRQGRALTCLVLGYMLGDTDTPYFCTALRDQIEKTPDHEVKTVCLEGVEKAGNCMVSRMNVIFTTEAMAEIKIKTSGYGAAEITLQKKSPSMFSDEQDRQFSHLFSSLLMYTQKKKYHASLKTNQ